MRLVDDSQVFLDATSDVLSQFSGCQVVGFTRSGVEALVRALAPDVVVTDLFMPGNERAGTDAEAFPPDVTPAAACPTTIPARR